MKTPLFYLVFLSALLASGVLSGQPGVSQIQADVKKEMGGNCIEVKITGKGGITKEFENGVWIQYHRTPVNAILRTEMSGVTRLMKGAAVYTVNGNKYHFKKYNTASGEYLGLKAPDVAEIKKFISSLPDLALGSRANQIIDIVSYDIDNSLPVWHTLQSVSIKATYVYWQKKSDFEQEQMRVPFELRLYKKDGHNSWSEASLMTPDAASDPRKIEKLGTKKYNGEKTLLEKGMQKINDQKFNSLPEVSIPPYTSTKDMAMWINKLLMEGDAGKAEKMFLMLTPASQKNNAGMLHPFAAGLLDKIKTALTNNYSTYKQQYCSTLMIKESSANSIEWWNKDKTKFSRMVVQQDAGTWYITDLSINLWQSFNARNAEMTIKTECR